MITFLQEKLLTPIHSVKEDLSLRFDFYNSTKSKTREFLNYAKKTSSQDIIKASKNFIAGPSVKGLLDLVKVLTNSGTWLSTSYIRHLHGLIDFSQKNLSKKYEELKEPRIQNILKMVQEGEGQEQDISDQEFFKAIFNELEFSYHNPSYVSPLTFPNVNITLMLVPGVFNEAFSTPAFDRGAQHLLNTHGIKYVDLKVSGTSGSEFNSVLIKDQIRQYKNQNPHEKIWLVGFSKGGLDILHYLASDADFADKNLYGVSTIASPIMGSEHVSNWVMRSINSIHKLSGTKLYQYFDSKTDVLAKEMQKSLSAEYQQKWFLDNHEKLPKNIFYTAVAFESGWLESHVWMKLAKIIFEGDSINDGVVDARNAFFPDYFNSRRLGIIRGHHLVGNRSSYYSQEALLEAHLIYLRYKKLI